MALASLSVFEMANVAIGKPFYDVRLLSESGGAVRTSIGLQILTERRATTHWRYAHELQSRFPPHQSRGGPHLHRR